MIKNELNKHSAILATSTSARLPDNIDTFTSAGWPGKDESTQFSINYNTADHEFVNLFDIEIIEKHHNKKTHRNGIENGGKNVEQNYCYKHSCFSTNSFCLPLIVNLQLKTTAYSY